MLKWQSKRLKRHTSHAANIVKVLPDWKVLSGSVRSGTGPCDESQIAAVGRQWMRHFVDEAPVGCCGHRSKRQAV
jgi:hypothetical protein